MSWIREEIIEACFTNKAKSLKSKNGNLKLYLIINPEVSSVFLAQGMKTIKKLSFDTILLHHTTIGPQILQ